MADSEEREHGEQDEESEAESREDGTINDPLTRTDVQAPRVPFGSDPEA